VEECRFENKRKQNLPQRQEDTKRKGHYHWLRFLRLGAFVAEKYEYLSIVEKKEVDTWL